MKLNYFDCPNRFKPDAGYGCNCSENKGGKCIPDNKTPGKLDECEYVTEIRTNIEEDDFEDYIEDYYDDLFCAAVDKEESDLSLDTCKTEEGLKKIADIVSYDYYEDYLSQICTQIAKKRDQKALDYLKTCYDMED